MRLRHLPTNRDRGAVTLYLTIILVAIVLGVSTGVHLIFTKQLRLVGGLGVSTLAFHAAEAGAERLLRLDTCLIIENETDRLNCIEEVSGINGGDIPGSCEGFGEPDDEQNCRTGVVNAMNALPIGDRQLGNGASYNFAIRDPNGDCGGNLVWGYCATSTGSYEDVVRRVEVVR